MVQAENQVTMERQMTLNRACQCKTLLRLSPKRWKEISCTAKDRTQACTFPSSCVEYTRTPKGFPPSYVQGVKLTQHNRLVWKGLAHHNCAAFLRQATSVWCFRPCPYMAQLSLEARWLLPASTHVDSQGTLPTGSWLFGKLHVGLIYGRKPP